MSRSDFGAAATSAPLASMPAAVPLSAYWMRPLLRLSSPGGARGRLSVLIYHRVHAQPDTLFPGEMHAGSFRACMNWVRHWFNVLPLDDAVRALKRGSLPVRALAITFDDGYADNCTIALPILRELGLHATFFVASGFLDGGRMWNDTVIETVRAASGPSLDLTACGLGVHPLEAPGARLAAIGDILRRIKYLAPAERQDTVDALARVADVALPSDLMMTSDQVRTIARSGMGIGGHTRTHPILARLDDVSARHEIAAGREELAAIVRLPVPLFAYPNGKPGTDYLARHAQMVKDVGFSAAVTTSCGAADRATGEFELPRFTPWDRSPHRWGLRMLRNLRVTPQCAAS